MALVWLLHLLKRIQSGTRDRRAFGGKSRTGKSKKGAAVPKTPADEMQVRVHLKPQIQIPGFVLGSKISRS